MAIAEEQGCIQILIYFRRKPSLTTVQFYEHWENVHAPKVIPWAEKHGIQRYQQMHVSGLLAPNVAIVSAPNDPNTGKLPNTPPEFDGIAVFVVESLQQFTDAFNDPYYLEVIEPDEKEFVDKEGSGGGLVARFQGKMFDMVHNRRSVMETKVKSEEYRKEFDEFEKRRRVVGPGSQKL